MRNRRLLFALFLCLAMVFGSVAWATEIMPLWDSCAMCAPDLYISGNTANCKLDVYAENSSDKITANIYLQKRNSLIGLSPSGKAQGFDPCITLVRIQLAQLRFKLIIGQAMVISCKSKKYIVVRAHSSVGRALDF